jgi:DNA-directed RNA polymerase specialized sigma24 family protein
MARIEWVRHRLEEWGRWSQQSESGALGFPSASPFARMGSSTGLRESTVPTNSLNASEMDDAVKSLQLSQSHLYMVVTLTYAKGLPRDQVARRMSKGESTISANLEAADRALARWLEDKAAVKKAAADSRRTGT